MSKPKIELHFLVYIILSFLSVLYSAKCQRIDADVRVRTPHSIYIGQQIKLSPISNIRFDANLNKFVGIRYGKAPIGKLRFQKSKPTWMIQSPTKTPIEVNAKEWGASCQQQPGFIDLLDSKSAKISEDCLFLNVWSPVNNTELKPVFVWFHGGSFISDSASRELYHAAHLSAIADMVVVTVNYRLDVFGFLYTGNSPLNATERVEGNQALWDQFLALEWVQDNIEYFNGDPTRVTIAGHNSGATSVGLHVLSPKSRRLFHRAVLMSGSVFSQLVTSNTESALQLAKIWAESLEKISCGTGSLWTMDKLNCLRDASSEKLLSLLDPIGEKALSPETIVGDDLLPFDNLLQAFNEFELSPTTNMSILLGSTDDEGGLVLPLLNPEAFSMISPKSLNQKEAFEELKRLASLLLTPRGTIESKVDGEQVARFYINQQNPNTNYGQVIGQAIGDFYVSCPLVAFANRLASVTSKSNFNVYQYVWSRKVPTSKDVPCAHWMGACHGSDQVMLFGQPLESPNEYSEEDQRNSVHFIRTIGHFVHHGVPAKQEGKQWPSYERSTVNGKISSSPYYEFSSPTKSKTRIYRQNWKTEICQDLWNKYVLPKL